MTDIGCYTLDLYCDGNKANHAFDEFPHTYSSNERNCKAKCYKAARNDGWIINSKFDRAFCPKCANERRPKWQRK